MTERTGKREKERAAYHGNFADEGFALLLEVGLFALHTGRSMDCM